MIYLTSNQDGSYSLVEGMINENTPLAYHLGRPILRSLKGIDYNELCSRIRSIYNWLNPYKFTLRNEEEKYEVFQFLKMVELYKEGDAWSKKLDKTTFSWEYLLTRFSDKYQYELPVVNKLTLKTMIPVRCRKHRYIDKHSVGYLLRGKDITCKQCIAEGQVSMEGAYTATGKLSSKATKAQRIIHYTSKWNQDFRYEFDKEAVKINTVTKVTYSCKKHPHVTNTRTLKYLESKTLECPECAKPSILSLLNVATEEAKPVDELFETEVAEAYLRLEFDEISEVPASKNNSTREWNEERKKRIRNNNFKPQEREPGSLLYKEEKEEKPTAYFIIKDGKLDYVLEKPSIECSEPIKITSYEMADAFITFKDKVNELPEEHRPLALKDALAGVLSFKSKNNGKLGFCY